MAQILGRIAMVGVILLVSVPLSGCRDKTGDGAKTKPVQLAPPVSVAKSVRKPMPIILRTFGTVEPLATVTIKSQITGVLTNILFAEGQEVRRDDLIFQIDSIPLANALRQAKAMLAKNLVLHANAAREAQRQKELLTKGLSSQDVYEQAQTQAEALAATVQADEAACESVRIQLDYCQIRSPVAGRTGRHLVDPGNLVKANETTLVTIHQVKPIQVAFALPQQELAGITRQMRGGALTVHALLPDEPDAPETGALTFLDNTIDNTTGTIQMKATFANEANRLWPGQFVRIALILSVQTDALIIPARAVLAGQQGSYVFLLKPDMSVDQRVVKVARTVEDEAVIASGLEPGDQVVTDGQQRLGPGIKVKLVATKSTPPTVAP